MDIENTRKCEYLRMIFLDWIFHYVQDDGENEGGIDSLDVGSVNRHFKRPKGVKDPGIRSHLMSF